MSKDKDDMPTRSFTVHEGKKTLWPETIVIQHDVSPLIRKTFGLDEQDDKQSDNQPAEIIPFDSLNK